VVGAETKGKEYMLLYLPRGDGLHEGWIEQSESQTPRAACSLYLCVCSMHRQ
jgi:hypothetical protein